MGANAIEPLYSTCSHTFRLPRRLEQIVKGKSETETKRELYGLELGSEKRRPETFSRLMLKLAPFKRRSSFRHSLTSNYVL
jgi:hypothetical protein